jgi:hypothetical protein
LEKLSATGKKALVPLVLGVVLVHWQRQTRLHELTAKAEISPHEVDVWGLFRARRDAKSGLVLVRAARFELDRDARVGVLKLLDDRLEGPIGRIVGEV